MTDYLNVPANYQLVAKHRAHFNDGIVTINRFQPQLPVELHREHVTLVIDRQQIIHEYSQLTVPNQLPLPDDTTAQTIAMAVIEQVEPARLSELKFLEIEDQTRFFTDKRGVQQIIPILWVKFGDQQGAFSWVGIAGGGDVIEYERQAYYDYVNGGGKTEQWSTDDWFDQHQSELLS